MDKPFIRVASVFGKSLITVSDGDHEISLTLTPTVIENLIDELQTVLDMAEE